MLFTYFDYIGYVLYKAISSAITVFTEKVIIFYLITERM